MTLGLLLAACYGGVGPEGEQDDDDSAVVVDDDDVGDDDDDEVVPLSMTCTPEQNPLTYAWEEPASVQLHLDVAWSDGSDGPPTGAVTWTVPPEDGSVDSAGLYTAPSNHGGQVEVEAWYDGHFASCALDLYVEIVIDMTGEVGDSADGIVPTEDDTCAPLVVYPLAGSMVPRSLAPPVFQWTEAPSGNAYVVSIVVGYATATVTTFETSWQPEEAVWFGLADSAADQTMTVDVAAGFWNGAEFFAGLCQASTSLQLTIGDFGLEGTVYYWSPTISGLQRIEVGDDLAEPWLDTNNTGYCVGCHSGNLSNADRLATNYGGGNQWSVVVDTVDPGSPVLGPEVRRGNFMALDPSGTRMVRSYEGALYLDDLEAGVQLSTVPTSGYATHPDWSPDGFRIAYSTCSSAQNNHDWVAFGCGINVLQVLPGDQFGSTEVLIPPDPFYSYYYPAFSPDGYWLAFTRAPVEGSSYDNPAAEVMLVSTTGGTATVLTNANGGPNSTNSYPRWSPSPGDTAWLAYSSRRPYGLVTEGVAQIWIAAIDLTVAGTGPDPSYPPIWMPGQDPAVGNHTPVWSPRYVGP